MKQLAVAQQRAEESGPAELALVSVVIVCYNQAHYLTEAIKSALAQSYCRIEVLVIDDGSTDDTAAVVSSFPTVQYTWQPNRGLSAARNAGIRCSGGDYIAFLDADDKLLPNAIQAGLDCFSSAPESAFVFGVFRNVFSDGSPAPTLPPQHVERDHYRRLLEGNYIGMHGAVLYRRSALAASGGFDESLRACEDYDLYLRIARDAPVRAHSEVVAEYRQHDSNMSKDHAFMLRHVLGVLDRERQRIPDRSCRRALRIGARVWREYYGTLLLEEWKASPSLRELCDIFRLWPGGVLRRGARALLNRAAGRYRPIRFGSLRRCTPVSTQFGFDRGQPVDRYYIEAFLKAHAGAVRGHVLEIGDDSYSKRFGEGRITEQDVLHVVPGFAGTSIVADLAHAPHIPSGTFDCIILTQTLHYIFDLRSAVATLHRILKPGGVLLATMPGISRICRDQDDRESDCWRFTASSVSRLFAAEFGEQNVSVRTYGNVLTAIAFLEGLAVQDLRTADFEEHDYDYQVVVAAAAIKRRKSA